MQPVLLPASALPSLRAVFPPRRTRPVGKGPRALWATRPDWRPRPPRTRQPRPVPHRRVVPPSRRRHRRVLRALARIITLVPVLALLAGMALLPAVVPVASMTKSTVDTYGNVPPLTQEIPDLPERSVLYAGDGTILTTLYKDGDRVEVSLEEVPQHVRNAVLAGEDARFYEHNGVDYRGIARALIANIESRGIAQGGSTLTQQFVKLLFTGNEVSLERKVREAIYAQELERRLTKDQILEGYLNLAHFGEGVYGIATAAEHYFSKRLDQLTLTEAAALAATLPAPTRFRPTQEANEQRRMLILDRLEELGWATPEEVQEARRTPLQINISERPNRFPYFHTYVRSQLLLDPRFDEALGPAGSPQRERMVFGGGLQVRTTLLPEHQRLAQAAVDDQLAGMIEQGFSGALASVDPRDGKVLSMVSGQDFEQSEVNLAVLGRGGHGYQPGSAFKTFFMLAALEQGISPRLRLDAPEQVTIQRPECPEGWSPGNSDGRATGQIDMYTATARSVNTYYAQLAARIGPQAGLEMARRLGITGIPQPGTPEYSNYAVCSLVLGTVNVSVLDMAAAYGVLANDGVRCEPYAIRHIYDAEGRLLWRHDPKCERVLDQDVSRTAVDMLQGGPRSGTGTRAYFGRPLGGKTGTAQDYTSAFFAGFTPQVSSAVWVGDPNRSRSMRSEFNGGRVFGGTYPALVFHDYMAAAHDGRPVERFPPPPPSALPQVAVPAVLGLPYQDAVATLQGAGLGVRADGDPPPDAVVTGTDPPPGTSVPVGTSVTVQVASGDAGERPRLLPMGVMPNVTGQPAEIASASLVFLGFDVHQQPVPSQTDQQGRVVSQDPEAGEVLVDEAEATLFVGTGAA